MWIYVLYIYICIRVYKYIEIERHACDNANQRQYFVDNNISQSLEQNRRGSMYTIFFAALDINRARIVNHNDTRNDMSCRNLTHLMKK